MDHVSGIPENEEYQEKTEYPSFSPPTHFQGSLKPPKRTMSAYACFSRKVYVCI